MPPHPSQSANPVYEMKALRRYHTTSTGSPSSNSDSSSPTSSTSPSSSWIHLRSFIVVAASTPATDRGNPKSPWARRKRKRVLSKQQWISFFTLEGRLRDGGRKFLKKVRSGGIDPSIRAEVWPFLLGVYDLNSTEAERLSLRTERRKEYEELRKQCLQLIRHTEVSDKETKTIDEISVIEVPKSSVGPNLSEGADLIERCEDDKETEAVEEVLNVEIPILDDAPKTSDVEYVCNAEPSHLVIQNISSGGEETDVESNLTKSHENKMEEVINAEIPEFNDSPKSLTDRQFIIGTEDTLDSSGEVEESNGNNIHIEEEASGLTHTEESSAGSESADSSSEDEPESNNMETDPKQAESQKTKEDFTTWQRIIRLDAIRANTEWIVYSPTQAAISEEKAYEAAKSVGLKDYDHLEPCTIYHASRLVAILEAYALYDQEIGYCQGMSDLLSPILAVIEEDDEAFWCFVSFMRKARHNFRLDEVGIRRQLNIVSKIIKSKDSHLYKHLEKLQAEDCFFVYRMVVVLFRRELDFEQTLCLWEVMWADQAAFRAGIGKSAWGRIRLRAPPTDDLLLYAIAACVLQRRKLIIESYSSMDEIIRECNSMAGSLDVWKLLDDAHDLVVTLNNRISTMKTTEI